MSDQIAAGILLEISPNLKSLRLLELPPNLLDLIRSNNPPDLMLKSTTLATNDSQHSTAHAVLCTNDRTFQVRQVQSSNSVYVLQQREEQSSSGNVNLPVASLCATAQCPSSLELVPAVPSSVAFLKQKLLVYNGEQTDDLLPATSAGLNPWDKASKYGILEDAPFSAMEFDQAWQELCAFEHGSASWVPTPLVLAQFWQAIVTVASAKGLKLDESFSISAISDAEEVRYPNSLTLAVLARICTDAQGITDDHVRLDRAKCVSWVGDVLLEAYGSESLASNFVEQWQDRLPEAWRKHARLEAIEGKFSENTGGLILHNKKESEGDSGASAIPNAGTAKAKAKPNWHERFKSAKRKVQSDEL